MHAAGAGKQAAEGGRQLGGRGRRLLHAAAPACPCSHPISRQPALPLGCRQGCSHHDPHLRFPSPQASAERHRSAQGRQRVPEEAEGMVRLARQLSGGLGLATPGSGTEQQQAEEEEQQQVWHPLQQDGEQREGTQCGMPLQQHQQGAPAPAAGGNEQTPPPAQLQRWPTAAAGPVSATPKAIGAVWELVQCCVGAVPLPPDPSMPKLPRPVGVRWYDARARVALLQVASWLQVRGARPASACRHTGVRLPLVRRRRSTSRVSRCSACTGRGALCRCCCPPALRPEQPGQPEGAGPPPGGPPCCRCRPARWPTWSCCSPRTRRRGTRR